MCYVTLAATREELKMTDQSTETHRITWDQLAGFAHAIDREITHVFRVFKGERQSPPIAEEFARYFGFPMNQSALAGRRPIRRVA